MKLHFHSKYLTVFVYIFITAMVTLAAVLVCAHFADILAFFHRFGVVLHPILYGFIFAFLLLPLVRLGESALFKKVQKNKKESKLRRALSIVTALLLVGIVIALLFLIIIPQASESYTDLSGKIFGYVDSAQALLDQTADASEAFFRSWLGDVVDRFPLFSTLSDSIGDFLDSVVTAGTAWIAEVSPGILQFVSDFFSEAMNILMGVIIAVYFLAAKEKLAAGARRICRAFFPDKLYQGILHTASVTASVFTDFYIGETFDAIVIGMLLYAFMVIFRMPYAPLISLLVGITCFIPSIGAYIGAIPGFFILLICAPEKALWFILIVFILQQLDSMFIEPHILQEQLSSLWCLCAIIVTTALIGWIGLLIGVPLSAVLRNLVGKALDRRLERKNLPTDIAAYHGGDLPGGETEQESKENA